DAQLVLEWMAVGTQSRPWYAGQEHQRSRLCLPMPGADRLDDRGIANQHGMEPFTQQTLRQLGVAPAGPHEICERAKHHAFAEVGADFQQGLRGGSQTDVLAIELVERVPPRLELCQRGLCLPARRARAHLLFVERADLPTCML